MSNSIWHKKHVFVVDKNGQVVVKLDDGNYGIIWVWKDKPLQDVMLFGENGIKFIEEYCYIDDLIAQADKAERLEIGLEDIQNQLEYRACLECKHCNQQLNAIEILKDIEQLTKEKK